MDGELLLVFRFCLPAQVSSQHLHIPSYGRIMLLRTRTGTFYEAAALCSQVPVGGGPLMGVPPHGEARTCGSLPTVGLEI